MAYDRANPPRCIRQVPGGGGHREWVYKNTDAYSVVRGAGYITNAKDLGMKPGDGFTYVKTDDLAVTKSTVLTVNNTTGVADLSDGQAISNTNT